MGLEQFILLVHQVGYTLQKKAPSSAVDDEALVPCNVAAHGGVSKTACALHWAGALAANFCG